jgi:hypothetical protein
VPNHGEPEQPEPLPNTAIILKLLTQDNILIAKLVQMGCIYDLCMNHECDLPIISI